MIKTCVPKLDRSFYHYETRGSSDVSEALKIFGIPARGDQTKTTRQKRIRNFSLGRACEVEE